MGEGEEGVISGQQQANTVKGGRGGHLARLACHLRLWLGRRFRMSRGNEGVSCAEVGRCSA